MNHEPVGEAEIATRLGRPPNTVRIWNKRRLLPKPDGYVSGRPAWWWGTIEKWARKTGRMG